jgi:uncharacterized Rossmann fold enzyme
MSIRKKKISVLPSRREHVIRKRDLTKSITEEKTELQIESKKSGVVATKRVNNVYVHQPSKPNYYSEESLRFKYSRYEKITDLEPIFLGETIYIVGGGPSLKDFDFEKLRNKIVIAVNKAFLYLPFAQVLYWSDSSFYDSFKKEIHLFKGIKATKNPSPKTDDIINLVETGRDGLELEPNAIRTGGNSGYAAINVAYHLGAKKIILMGFDAKNGPGGNTHWHDGYNKKGASDEVMQRNWLPHYYSIVNALEDRRVKIYNTSKFSEIKEIEKITITEALEF